MMIIFTFCCALMCVGATILLSYSIIGDLMQSIKDYRAKNLHAISTVELIVLTVADVAFMVALLICDYNMAEMFLNLLA